MGFQIKSGVIPKAQKVILYGVEGIGKTTFASQFPDPLFIDTEDSSLYLNVKRFDKPTSWTMLLQEVDFVKQTRPCRTLIIDTMDWGEGLAKKHLMAQNHWQAIDSTGYGTRYVALADEIGKLLNSLSEVIELGINVVITAHAWLRKKEEPDEMGAYDRYELKLEKKTAPLVKEWADMVLFANYKTTIITDDKTNSKKATGGQRVMYTTHRPSWDAKNRLGLQDELPFAYSQIAQAFEAATNIQTQQVTQTAEMQDIPLPPVPEETPEAQGNPVLETSPAPEYKENIPAVIPQDVADLMKINQVTVEEAMQIIYQGGFMPKDTPIENIPTDLWGYLATNWDKALGLLNSKIRK
ncbi:ATP-binding protein [Liquorilactobacillus satsumensis]|uniref:ATP-binding protein n=1 Tax=Liquorilactobacillus satsumensis TaxID=259059 RepID=UPI0039E8A66E